MNKKPIIIISTIIVSLLLLCCCVLCVGLILIQRSNPEPTDKEMIEYFNKNKSTFNQIQGLAEIERGSSTYIRITRTSVDGSIEPGKVSAIRSLMEKINIKSLSIYTDSIEFTYYTSGISVSGSSKNFVYSTTTPTNIFTGKEYSQEYPKSPVDFDTSNFQNKGLTLYIVYREIEKNWYIQNQFDL